MRSPLGRRSTAFVLCSLITAALSAVSAPALAEAPHGAAQVEALGVINGTALACGYVELVPRAKGAVIHSAPKTRRMGLLFEEATQARYMALMEEPSRCPGARELHRRLEAAVAALQEAFPGAQ